VVLGVGDGDGVASADIDGISGPTVAVATAVADMDAVGGAAVAQPARRVRATRTMT
jgi:hypothetical protein